MIRSILTMVVVAVATFVPDALAQRQPVPIVERENLPALAASGAALTPEAIAAAITRGAENGKIKWIVSRAGADRLTATYNVRTHSISVNIVFTEKTYSVFYSSSINMKYGVENGVKVIHPFYNRWVDELVQAIGAEFRKL